MTFPMLEPGMIVFLDIVATTLVLTPALVGFTRLTAHTNMHD